ncbi:queuine tRNA-ribosyltransferase accessory subunit 2-like [Pecten maximus]|uniref:queuine tRNA-ribosyltransferase accessory subunit 2-like n=1 Tax=Pecten maximus TaxID=6579 RepID=UPI0014583AF3|nr:queuine tRNA-ribosyltransferase accessory subunit 2-like [Pecten maximus]
MKFVVNSVKNGGCRLGVMSEFGLHGKKTVETPMCMLYTRRGSAPHLTADMLKKIQWLPPMAQMSLTNMIEHHEALEAYKEGIGKFANMKDYLVYNALHDPATEVMAGQNDTATVGVWTKSGKVKMDVDMFVRIQEAFKPDVYQALSDGDTDLKATKKRINKSVTRTLTYLDQLLERLPKSEILKDAAIFGVIEGGNSVFERCRSARETASRDVAGFVIEGFHTQGPQTEFFKLSDVRDTLRQTVECLPDDKPRLMHAAFPPDQVLEALELGLDIFDSSYAYHVTERGCALVFDFTHKADPEDMADKKTVQKGWEIDLNDKRYFEDFGPLLEGCYCYTCKNFSRSYVNHLRNTSELLGSVLLMIHNFQHYFHYFEAIRRALVEDKYEQLKTHILRQKLCNSS